MTTMKNGWHKVYGIEVYVEDGRVVRGQANGRPIYAYRENRRYGGWDKVTSLSVSAIRAGLNRGTIEMC